MSDKLRKQIEVERQQLRRLIEVHQPLIKECASRQPTDIELSALAFFLETFYSGIENIFKRIAVELEGGLPQGDAWGIGSFSTWWPVKAAGDRRLFHLS